MSEHERYTFIVEQEGERFYACLSDNYPVENAGVADTPLAAIIDYCQWLQEAGNG